MHHCHLLKGLDDDACMGRGGAAHAPLGAFWGFGAVVVGLACYM